MLFVFILAMVDIFRGLLLTRGPECEIMLDILGISRFKAKDLTGWMVAQNLDSIDDEVVKAAGDGFNFSSSSRSSCWHMHP
jgi:hypothetical protein